MRILTDPRVEQVVLDKLRLYPGNPRTHSKKQIQQIAASIQRFGFTSPLLVSDDLEIIAGAGRLLAARQLGLERVPVIRLAHLDETERRAYVLADNQLALQAGWDKELLAIELGGLIELEFDLSVIGFEASEVEIILGEAAEANQQTAEEEEDVAPPLDAVAVTRPGDVWLLGAHRLICGDARRAEVYDTLLGSEEVGLVFTDPPYNVPIARNVSGRGEVRHGDFAMATGEMNREEFTQFLEAALGAAASRCRDGAIAYVCMDWRHMMELQLAGELVFSELKNLCVWNKGIGGQGSFYRSQHELVFVFKVGSAPHINNFGLGGGGRYRTNVWDYAGANGFSSSGRTSDLALHPTVKPVAMIKDALLDCSKRGDIVLDCFAGSGSTLAAAHKTGRKARLIEYDPRYCDVIVQRYEQLTGKQALLQASGQPSEEVAAERLASLEGEGGQ